MSEFFLMPDRRRRLLSVLRKHDADRAEYFLSMCEREIVSWLKTWPNMPPPARDIPSQLEHVRRKAFELFEAVNGLDHQAGWMLAHWLLSHEDEGNSQGVMPADVWHARDALKFDLLRLARAAQDCHDPHEGPAPRRPDQDLSDRLARAYTDIFRELPSVNMEDGVFAAFCEELANDMPEGVTFTVSRTTLERSRLRCAYLLNDSP
ncbi:MAG: hypothetical protein PWP40_98 [Rhodocyclaceae bacterium]|nr:hypothetical protein [Rhodocyclaceae bacterium]